MASPSTTAHPQSNPQERDGFSRAESQLSLSLRRNGVGHVLDHVFGGEEETSRSYDGPSKTLDIGQCGRTSSATLRYSISSRTQSSRSAKIGQSADHVSDDAAFICFDVQND